MDVAEGQLHSYGEKDAAAFRSYGQMLYNLLWAPHTALLLSSN